jgi:hypothetical protein
MKNEEFTVLYEELKKIQKKLFKFQSKETDLEILRKLKLIDAELIDALHNLDVLQKSMEKR